MINVLVADDHAVVREGLKHILSETSDMKVADEAKTGHEVLSKVRTNGLDMVVLDISMPGRSGLDLLKEIKNQRPKLPVLVISMDPEDHYAVRALRAGASGCLTKESQPEEFIKAIRNVTLGRKYISSSIAEKLVHMMETGSEKPLHESLSDQEYHVLCMIASGKRVTEIAQELCLSTKTISTYRCRILQKMEMKNNAELTNYAIKTRLVE
jgi:DNA-binding NarL/FixJ family response regulator